MTFDPTSMRLNEDGKSVQFYVMPEGTILLPLSDAIALHAALGKFLQVAAGEQKPQSDIDVRAEQAKEAETKI